MADDVLRHLHLGFMRVHVLYHAAKEPICGVELMEELSHHGYDIGPGTLYPMLRQMEVAGLLKCRNEIVGGKRRKNVRITPAGKKLLRSARAKLRELAAEVLDDRDARHRRNTK
jgi:DNA-binding PadR family transcriptional regulator